MPRKSEMIRAVKSPSDLQSELLTSVEKCYFCQKGKYKVSKGSHSNIKMRYILGEGVLGLVNDNVII